MNFYNNETYRITNGQAYTDDNILIYNIYITNLPKGANTYNITEYFSKFGEVLNVGFLGNGKGYGKKCFVKFVDPKVAAKVLQQSKHVLMKRTMRVQPSRSWFQPNGRNVVKVLDAIAYNNSISDTTCSTSTTSDHSNALILNLNDDCLEYICGNLSLNDQINFALTCSRFCDIFKMHSKVKYTNFSTDSLDPLTQFQSKIFLQLVGSQIKTLLVDFSAAIYDDFKESLLVKFFGLFCKNVEKLTIETCTLHASKLSVLIKKMQQLKELELNYIEINMALIKCLTTLKSLKSLSITENTDLTGKNIHLLTGLEKLSLYGCHSLSSYHFKKICQNLKNLRYLDIRTCDLLKTNDYEQILENLLLLETLKIGTTKENINCLTRLPKLRHLEIDDHRKIPLTEEFFKELAQNQSEQLEELKMADAVLFNLEIASLVAKLNKLKVFYCDNDAINDESLEKLSQLNDLEEVDFINCNEISNKGILRLLEHCKKLKRLNLVLCELITPDFIRNAHKLLLEQHARLQRTNSVHITLSHNSDFESMIDEIKLKESSDVLKITLDKFLNNIFAFKGLGNDFDDDDDDDDYDYGYPFDDYDYFSGADEYDYSGDDDDDAGYGYNPLEDLLFIQYGNQFV